MTFIVPPGGLAGFSQMTPASKAALGGRSSARSSGRRKRKTVRASRSKTARNGRKASGRKLKFGSPAWQKKYKVGKFRK